MQNRGRLEQTLNSPENRLDHLPWLRANRLIPIFSTDSRRFKFIGLTGGLIDFVMKKNIDVLRVTVKMRAINLHLWTQEGN